MSRNDLCRQGMPSHLYGVADNAARALTDDSLLLVELKKEGEEVVLNSARRAEVEALLRGDFRTPRIRQFLGLDPSD